jgi:GTP cyclohydrolase I
MATTLPSADRRAAPVPAREDDGPRAIDHAAMQRAARELLRALGADVDAAGVKETPRRMADLYAELLTPPVLPATPSANHYGYEDMIVARGIPFHSLCTHHLLPFGGVAHVGYLPAGRILGPSDLAAVVERFARDLQVQERLTTQIAGWLQRQLQPAGIGVVLEAEHSCMSLRGVRKSGVKTVTSALRGLIRDDSRARRQFLALTGRNTHEQ